jgi:hypothetical protein
VLLHENDALVGTDDISDSEVRQKLHFEKRVIKLLIIDARWLSLCKSRMIRKYLCWMARGSENNLNCQPILVVW